LKYRITDTHNQLMVNQVQKRNYKDTMPRLVLLVN